MPVPCEQQSEMSDEQYSEMQAVPAIPELPASGAAEFRELQSLVPLQRHTYTPLVREQEQRAFFKILDLLHIRRSA